MTANAIEKLNPIRLTALAAIACIMAVTLILSFGTQQAWAGGNPTLEALGGKTFVLSYKGKAKDCGYRNYYPMEGSDKKITNVKSSNKKVATAKVLTMGSDSANTSYYLRVKLKSAGTTKLSFKHSGKKYAVKYTVNKYKNPLSSLKIGPEEYVSYGNLNKLNDHGYYASSANVPVSAFTGKVSVKPKDGWKIDEIMVYPKGKPYKTIKNGGKAKNASQIGVMLTNETSGQWEVLYLNAAADLQTQSDSQLAFASTSL